MAHHPIQLTQIRGKTQFKSQGTHKSQSSKVLLCTGIKYSCYSRGNNQRTSSNWFDNQAKDTENHSDTNAQKHYSLRAKEWLVSHIYHIIRQ